MEIEYKDFIGIYDDSIPIELCKEFVDGYEKGVKNNTIIDLTKPNKIEFMEKIDNERKDTSMFVSSIFSTIFPPPPVRKYFNYLKKCFEDYEREYDLNFSSPLYNDVFKIHKVKKTEGYHVWHYEKNTFETMNRVVVYMTYLEAPKEGGETEFLFQLMRIKPIVGRTLIWPTGFTHKHRGNPPLEGEKLYITGWFTASRMPPENTGL